MFRFKKLVWEVLLLIVLSGISWAGTVYVKYFDKVEKCYTVQKSIFCLKHISDIDKEAIVSVEILGNGIRQIVPRCFSGCKNLTDIVIASSVQIIGYDCFRGCKNLKNMTISKKLWDKTCGNTEQEKRSWLGLKDDVKIKTLVSVCIKFFSNQEERYTEEESVFTLKRSSNSYREAIVSVEILGNGINEIGDFGFAGCLNLVTVSIPKSVTKLGCDCFYNCKSLRNIVIPDSVMEIRERCFTGCENLVTISISSSVKNLSDDCFYNCKSLRNIDIPNSVTVIGQRCFHGCENLITISIPSSVKKIGYACFSGCKKLNDITIPKSVIEIGYACFCDCKNLTTISLPNSLTRLGGYFLCGCENLEKIDIPNSVVEIGKGCFRGCIKLTSISIPNSVAKIDRDCFYDCKKLEYITLAIALCDKIPEDMDSEKGAYLGLEDFVYMEREKYETVYKFHVMRPLTLFRMCLREIKKVQQWLVFCKKFLNLP